MKFALIILVLLIIILLYFYKKNKAKDNSISTQNRAIETTKTRVNDSISNEDGVYTDENGLRYKIVEKRIKVPRRTYIYAELNAKYWGVKNEVLSEQFYHSKFFDFNIYEVTLNSAVYNEEPFNVKKDYRIPRERLPKLLHTILKKDGKEYEINLHEPILSSINFSRKLHQEDGKEVFGTFDSIVTGYILDFIEEVIIERKYIVPEVKQVVTPLIKEDLIYKTLIPTGNVEYKSNYKRIEYYYSDLKKTYWGDWIYVPPTVKSDSEGCFSTFIGLIFGIIFISYLLIMLPQLAIIIPFFVIIFILNLIPAKYLVWIIKFIGAIVLISLLAAFIHLIFNRSQSTFVPKPKVVDNERERVVRNDVVLDTLNSHIVTDTLIKHFRAWQDYDGNEYSGEVWTKMSDFANAKDYKNRLRININSPGSYDNMLFNLKENDKNNLNGVYQLFDSIRETNELGTVQFAEVIVSFVQDIPYTIILPEDCNPSLYEDKFIKDYLMSDDANCEGYAKYGINSPVEFMSTFNGDCDTRTLLLYTILSHYGYDVALMSSEYYSHSIIGVNLPYSGMAYKYQNKRYVLWETTAPNLKPGVLPKEISNLNYWRISLKSK